MEQAKIPERYRLLEEVGQGGMAVVYRAQDETLKREVAIKVLHQHLATESESKARLEREAQAVAKLRHENILEIFDYSGTESERSYIVTEFIDGVTLKQFLESRRFAHPEIAALIAMEIGGALAHAHGLGIIHRDVKPENVMIRKDGLLKLMDFGIAQVVDLQRMTVTGQLLGSPAYMAPELVEGKPLDFRTDVFSVGIMLYQLATGSLPFSGKNPHEVLRRIAEGKFPDPRSLNRRIPDVLARVIARALARRPDDRYPDVSRLVEELREALADGGLTDARGELRAYFGDPDGYDAALPARLAAALTAAAEQHLGAGRSARAIELWNRVLLFDPQNAGVLAALRRLEGRNRLRMVGLTLLAGCVVAAGAFGLQRVLPPSPAKAPPLAAAAAAAPAVSAPTPTAPLAPTPPPTTAPRVAPTTAAVETAVAVKTPARRVAAVRRTEPRPPAAPVAEAPARTFTLGPTPQNVDVYLDGVRQFAYDTDHQTITVPWSGDHVIELRSPSGCCFVERIPVGPDHAVPADAIIARRLHWRPARLQITTDPPAASARVMVRDPNRHGSGAAGRPGEEIDVPFAPDDDASKEVEIAVDTGDAFASERLTVRAGQRTSHVVKLKPSSP
jgi:serine/threonine-protein kinase